jgi:hypothetical protein
VSQWILSHSRDSLAETLRVIPMPFVCQPPLPSLARAALSSLPCLAWTRILKDRRPKLLHNPCKSLRLANGYIRAVLPNPFPARLEPSPFQLILVIFLEPLAFPKYSPTRGELSHVGQSGRVVSTFGSTIHNAFHSWLLPARPRHPLVAVVDLNLHTLITPLPRSRIDRNKPKQ